MKINNNQNSISFQKRHVADGGILKNGKPSPCKIYQLEMPEDSEYIPSLSNTDEWERNAFHYTINSSLVNDEPHCEIFVLEDEDDACLGLMETRYYKLSNKRFVENVETSPLYSNDVKKRKVKYVGETMMSFLAKKAEENKLKDKIIVSTPLDPAVGFYKKTGFIRLEDSRLLLPTDNIEKLLDQNEQNTGKRLELIG